MAALIDFSALTLNAEEARSASECIQEQVYAKPQLTAVHEVMTGVEMDRYIPILGKYGIVGKADPGSCGNNDITTQIPVAQKKWEPKLISGKLAHCQADLPDLLKFWKKSRKANGYTEEVENEMMAFITERVMDAVLESIFRHAEFGDKAADVVAEGGQLTAGTVKTFFNVIDGMWKQIFTDNALGAAAKSVYYTITENALDSTAKQLELASDRALLMFRYLYSHADSRIFEGNNPVFQVTKSLFDNWQDMLEDKSLIFSLDRTEKGSNKWSYRGIPIVVRNDWDRTIKAYHNLGATLFLPHRAILTDIANIPIGTSDSESMSEFKSWYSMDDEKHYIKFAYKIDQKNLQEELIAAAF